MKKILITGKNSYLGMHVQKELSKYNDLYLVEELDMLDNEWEEHDFSKYDVIYHVAGLAHSAPSNSQRELYYQVNSELAYKVGKKAFDEGVSQFIFMSSIIVYGNGTVEGERIIRKETVINPDNFYGDSKRQAELKLMSLKRDGFKLVIVRPPMIYGENSKGNYPLLSKFARKTLIFPTLKNERSMLYVGNLVEFIRCAIDYEIEGVFFPQNKEYVSSIDLVKEISKIYNHKVYFIGFFNPLLKIFKNNRLVNKVFGNLVIDKKLSTYAFDYQKYDFEQSVKLTETLGDTK